MSEIILETKLVGDITGKFFIPSYQRGYRWGKDEVERLLDDVYSIGEASGRTKNYCLQPIVVRRKAEDEFELIDELSALSATEIPNAIKEIRNAQIRHNRECDSDKMKEIVKEILNV